jgi:hypothetical protein
MHESEVSVGTAAPLVVEKIQTRSDVVEGEGDWCEL